MRILLDENLDWRLGRDLLGHEVSCVPKIGWAGIKNGELIRRASGAFDVLLTLDTGISHQQNIAKSTIAVLILRAPSNRLADTRPLMPKVLALLGALKPGTVTEI